MSIPVLTQVYDEVRRLSIAGSTVAPGDFRLKKLVPPLEQSGQKAPVFAKVAQSINQLLESTEQTSAAALLEVSTLVNAILYTQGETGLAGELKPIQTTNLGQQQTQTSARVLKPLFEALSETGGGRLEVVRDAFERGAFRDLRLVGPAVAALDDPYPEIADFIAQKVLPPYGKAILPDLREKFDVKGRGGHARRLMLMHRLDPEGTRETIKRALDEGSREIKIIAIECLGSTPDELSYLLEQSKAKARDVRMAALKALSRSDADDAVKTLCEVLKGKDIDLAMESVRTSRNPHVLEFVLAQIRHQFEAVLAEKSKDKEKLSPLTTRLLSLLECLRKREDESIGEVLLELFHQRQKLAAVKGDPSGKDIEQRLVSIMAFGPKASQQALIEAHASLPEDELADAFHAARLTRSPAEVFELFSGYVTAKVDEKKKRDPVWLKREAIVDVLNSSHVWSPYDSDFDEDNEDAARAKLDPRWLDVAVQLEHAELVRELARPGHAKANQLLSKLFDEQLKKFKDVYELSSTLRTMVRVQHPDAADAIMATVGKHAKATHYYGLYWIAQLIPDLPAAALPKIEAWLPTLPENVIDQLLDYVTQLKSRSST